MITIFCYGDSNTWGWIPDVQDNQINGPKKYAPSERWTGILQNELGDAYRIVEDGFCGRTTAFDDTVKGRPYRNGLTQLPISLGTHYPIDLVIFMLGTNDVNIKYNKSLQQIKEGLRQLIKVVKQSNKNPQGKSPKILLIAPPPLRLVTESFDATAIKKSIALSYLYNKLAGEEGCTFLNASAHITTSEKDGAHFEKSQLAPLGRAVARLVKKMSLVKRIPPHSNVKRFKGFFAAKETPFKNLTSLLREDRWPKDFLPIAKHCGLKIL